LIFLPYGLRANCASLPRYDHRGVMNLNIPGGGTLAFAMLSNGNAKFVEVDASGNHGTVGAGTMEKVDASAFNTAKITAHRRSRGREHVGAIQYYEFVRRDLHGNRHGDWPRRT